MPTCAIADQVPPECDYITAGKEYLVLGGDGYSGWITDDKGVDVIVVWIGCEFIKGNWRRVER